MKLVTKPLIFEVELFFFYFYRFFILATAFVAVLANGVNSTTTSSLNTLVLVDTLATRESHSIFLKSLQGLLMSLFLTIMITKMSKDI